MKLVKLKWLGDQVLKVIVVLSVAWTFLALVMLVKVKVFTPSTPPLDVQSTVTLPKLSPSYVFQDFPDLMGRLMASNR